MTDLDALLADRIERLRLDVRASRATLRLDVPDAVYPVRFESLADGVGSVRDLPTVDMANQPIPKRLLAGEDQVVEEDCRAARPDDAAYHAMLEAFGGMQAQIVTAVRDPSRALVGIISVHDVTGARRWTAGETAAATAAAAEVAEVLGS